MTNQQSLLNTVQAGHLLGLHPDTLRLWRKQGRGPDWVRVGNRYRYSQDSISAFLARGEKAL